jgi:magnesium transporter
MAKRKLHRGRGPRPAPKTPPAPASPKAARAPRPRITLFDYNASGFTEREVADPSECLPYRQADSITWVNVDGMGDPELIRELAQVMGFHALTVEDILNMDQRPKAEDYGDYLYVAVKMLDLDPAGEITIEQLSLVIGPNYVISIQEEPGDPFEPVRARIRNGVGRIRALGADYLAYRLLSVIVDRYFSVTDRLSERIEELDELVAGRERPDVLRAMYQTKRDIIYLRKAVTPLREVVATLWHSESNIVQDATVPYLRDLYDHVVQAADRVDTSRDLLASVQDLYLTRLSNRTSTVMKIIAVFSSIFLPLTFITGIFGMNFEFMPLIHKPWGFGISAGAMLLIVGGMLWYFRRKRWI